MKYYIDSDGNYIGGWDQDPPDSLIEVSFPPEQADQLWLFSDKAPFWSVSSSASKAREFVWQAEELLVIANQLLALEEDASDALPGNRGAWLSYRTRVRLWQESSDFPNQKNRPRRPTKT